MIYRVLSVALILLTPPAALLRAQTATPNQIPDLEQKLAATEAPAEKAALCNELSFAWQKKDPAKAVQYAEDACKLATAGGSSKEAMKALNLLGDAALRQNNFAQVEKAYQDALDQAKKASDREMEARALHNLGKLAQRTDKLDQAAVLYEQAFQIREQIGDQAGLSSTVQNLAVLYAKRSDYEKSITYCQRSLELKEAVGDRPGMATVKTTLGNNYAALGRYADAEPLFRSAIQINADIGNNSGVAGGCLSLGSLLEATGRTDSAIVSFEKAVSIFQALGDQVTACGAQVNIAQCLAGRAQYPEAQQRFLEALQVVENVPQTNALRYVIYHGLGRVKGFQMLYREELDYYAKAMPYVADDLKRVSLLQVMAGAYIGDVQFEKGLSIAQEGLQIARKNGFREREVDCLYQSASALLNLDRLPEALRAIDAAISTAKKNQYQSSLPASLVARSHVLNRLNQDHQAALTAAQQALALAQKMGKPLEISQAWEQLSEAYRTLNEADKAVDALRNSQRLNDSIFSKADIRELAGQEKEYEFDKERAAQRAEKAQMENMAAAKWQQQRAQRNYWIFGLSSLLVIGLLTFFLWRSRQRARTKLRETETRLRIARDLHDEVGSTLSSISILSASALRGVEKDLDNARFGNIGEKARAALDSISDIVWSVNPENDSMEKALARMSAYASEMLENVGVELRFEVDEGVEDLTLPMEKRKDFYLIFKEAIHNCAKYARANHVEVAIKKEDNALILSIKDDGVGFETDNTEPGARGLGGNGLRNMRSRAAAMGGRVEVTSAPGTGTEVRLALPV